MEAAEPVVHHAARVAAPKGETPLDRLLEEGPVAPHSAQTRKEPLPGEVTGLVVEADLFGCPQDEGRGPGVRRIGKMAGERVEEGRKTGVLVGAQPVGVKGPAVGVGKAAGGEELGEGGGRGGGGWDHERSPFRLGRGRLTTS